MEPGLDQMDNGTRGGAIVGAGAGLCGAAVTSKLRPRALRKAGGTTIWAGSGSPGGA